MTRFNYSPHPMEAYRVPVKEACAVTALKKMPYPAAIWNLLWLSVPELDALLRVDASTPLPQGWHEPNFKVTSALRPVIADALEDEEMRGMLICHPDRFLAWFSKEDHTIFDCYDGIGPHWVDTVMDRAEQAARIITPPKPVLRFENNVVWLFPDSKVA